jgi:hypothetical protein
MIRILLTIVLPLLLPTLLYLLWLAASRRAALAAPSPSRDMPWIWLAGAGIVLAALLLFFINIRVGSQGAYVPPKYIDGHVVPGHVVPTEAGK